MSARARDPDVGESHGLIKVVAVESGATSGGSFESLLQLAQSLDPKKYRLHVVFLNKTAYEGRFQRIGVDTYVFDDPVFSVTNSRLSRALASRVRDLIARFSASGMVAGVAVVHRKMISSLTELVYQLNADLIYMNDSPLRNLPGYVVARRTRVPVVSHLRSTHGAERLDSYCHRLAESTVHAFIANSRYTQQETIQHGFPADRLHVVYNGIEKKRIVPIDPRSQFEKAGSSSPIILMVGNFLPDKGHLHLVDAFERVSPVLPQAHLVLLGQGPLEAKIARRVERLKLFDRVTFGGYRNDALQLIAGADILVIPSKNESFGRVAIEAMHVGTPVVASRVGGLSEIIEDGKSGVLVPYGDSRDLANSIIDLWKDEDRRMRLCEAAALTVSSTFSSQAHAEGIVSIWDDAIRAKGGVSLGDS